MHPTFTESLAGAGPSRVQEARGRIRDRYYDRPEVRRMLAAVLLRRFLRPQEPAGPVPGGPSDPEVHEPR